MFTKYTRVTAAFYFRGGRLWKKIFLLKCCCKLNRILLKIPTGGKLTSWPFTKRGGVEFDTTKHKSIQWQGGGLEPGTSGLQIQRPNH